MYTVKRPHELIELERITHNIDSPKQQRRQTKHAKIKACLSKNPWEAKGVKDELLWPLCVRHDITGHYLQTPALMHCVFWRTSTPTSPLRTEFFKELFTEWLFWESKIVILWHRCRNLKFSQTLRNQLKAFKFEDIEKQNQSSVFKKVFFFPAYPLGTETSTCFLLLVRIHGFEGS